MPVSQTLAYPRPLRRALLAALLATATLPALACGDDAYIGQICIVAGNYCPNNTAETNGQLLAINTYQALYSLVGVTYGGDGRTTFGVPDIRGRAPIGYGQGPGLTAHPIGTKFGAETVTATLAQLPQHAHGATFTPTGGSSTSVTIAVGTAAGNVSTPAAGSTVYLAGLNADYGGDPVNVQGPYASALTSVANLGGITVTNSSSGGGGGTVTVAPTPTAATQAMSILDPQIALRYCIVLNGIYPPRP